MVVSGLVSCADTTQSLTTRGSVYGLHAKEILHAPRPILHVLSHADPMGSGLDGGLDQ